MKDEAVEEAARREENTPLSRWDWWRKNYRVLIAIGIGLIVVALVA